MTTIAFANAEPLPGYVLTERIGSGGYGEVWRATAPGGVEKAVKTLFGYHDEELAARELKALERIKDVRHPFLLAIDRFEVVEGRLVVVTELADMSLDQCFQRHRRQLQEGIPRDELLSYLHDAADALDHMHQKHSLQHLDVKPENLLILGGHMKVADFGLVKDVTRQTQNSLVGGMTPTYAAPEVFDNRPGPRTDQYSLAIVYQEMLTGSLPFPGKSPAQLVAQHLQGRPRVAALPTSDQSIVLRALSKDPKNRYDSCTHFVEALINAKGTDVVDAAPSGDREVSVTEVQSLADTSRSSSSCTEPVPQHQDAGRDACTQPIDRVDGNPLPGSTKSDEQADDPENDVWLGQGALPEQPSRSPFAREDEIRKESGTGPLKHTISISVSSKVFDSPVPAIENAAPTIEKTLLIGVGGAGGSVLRRVRKRLLDSDAETAWRLRAPMLAIDTDVEELKTLREKASDGGPILIDTAAMPLKRPQQYRDNAPETLQWLSRRWLYNIPRSLKTRGYRPLGRLALIDNATSIVGELERKLRTLAEVETAPTAESPSTAPSATRVMLVASTSGGTGGGTAIDVAYALRRIAAELKLPKLEIVGVFGDCHGHGGEANKLSLANTYAFLAELASVAASGNCSPNPPPVLAVFEGDEPPFDHVYFASSMGKDLLLDGEDWVEQAALYVATCVGSQADQLLTACRSESPSHPDDEIGGPLIRSFAAASLDESRTVLERRARERICEIVSDRWRRASDPDAKARNGADDHLAHARNKPTSGARRGNKKQDAAQDEMEAATIERLRLSLNEQFGDAANGRLAVALFAAVLQRIEEKPSLMTEDDGATLSRLVHRSASAAVQELNDVVCRLREGVDAEKVISARCLTSDVLVDADEEVAPLSETARTIADQLAQRAQQDFLGPLLASGGKHPLDLGELLWQASAEVLDQVRSKPGIDEEILLLAGPSADIEQTARATSIRPHRCGHVCRTVVVAPSNWRNGALEEVVSNCIPHAAFITAQVATPLLIREASEISLAQAASRILELQPDVRDAATRLHTRADIQWAPLAPVVTVDE